MADHLDFVAKNLLVRLEKHIRFCVCGQTEVIIIHTVESVDGVSYHRLVFGVPTLVDLAGIPTFRVVEHWNNIDVFQQSERS